MKEELRELRTRLNDLDNLESSLLEVIRKDKCKILEEIASKFEAGKEYELNGRRFTIESVEVDEDGCWECGAEWDVLKIYAKDDKGSYRLSFSDFMD